MKVIVEFELDGGWDEYRECSDEIIYSDLSENGWGDMIGVRARLIRIERESTKQV